MNSIVIRRNPAGQSIGRKTKNKNKNKNGGGVSQKTLRNRRKRQRRRGNSQVVNPPLSNSALASGFRGRPNSYLSALVAPWNCRGNCRIPDAVSYPSATFQTRIDDSITVDSGGYGGYAISPALDARSSNSVTTSGFTFGGTPANDPAYGALSAAYQKFRPVSMGFKIEYVGTTLSDSGTIIVSMLAPGEYSQDSVANAMSTQNAKRYALRDGCSAIWKPFDNTNLEYQYVNTVGANIVTGSIVPNFWPMLIVYVYGATASTTPLNITTWTNYEAITTFPAFGGARHPFLQTELSPSDVNALEGALNYVGQLPISVPGLVAGAIPMLTGALAVGLSRSRARVASVRNHINSIELMDLV